MAILPWGLLYDEDFLDTIGVTLEAFCTEMTGGYLFNYVDALKLVGLRPLIVIVARRARTVSRLTHQGTGASVLVLPAPGRLGVLRSIAATTPARWAGRRLPRLGVILQEIAAYLSTPTRILLRELRRERCAALICQEYEYTRFDECVMVGHRLRVPVFATFQGGNQADGQLQRLARPFAIRRAAGLIIGTRLEIGRVQDRYDVPDAKIARIFNPVDPSSFDRTPRPEARTRLGIGDDARVAIWYGRVERHNKGLDTLLDAWGRICRDRPAADLRLFLIGTGRDADWLRDRIAQPDLRGVSWQDRYIHDRSILRLHLSAADVFVYPSRQEGFPVAPIEAMACGVPVVAAAAPGVPDILEGGESAGGLVIAPGDVAALATTLSGVLDDRARAARIGAAGRARAHASFSLAAVGAQLRDFMVRRGLRVSEVAHE